MEGGDASLHAAKNLVMRRYPGGAVTREPASPRPIFAGPSQGVVSLPWIGPRQRADHARSHESRDLPRLWRSVGFAFSSLSRFCGGGPGWGRVIQTLRLNNLPPPLTPPPLCGARGIKRFTLDRPSPRWLNRVHNCPPAMTVRAVCALCEAGRIGFVGSVAAQRFARFSCGIAPASIHIISVIISVIPGRRNPGQT